jgi:hypothetical protein
MTKLIPKEVHMRRVLCSFVVVAVVLFATSLPALAASTTPTQHVTAKGGSVTMSATVDSAGWCVWSSSPKVPGFNVSIRCKSGTVSRSAKIGPNWSTEAKDYLLSLNVIAESTIADHLEVVEAGAVPTAINFVGSYVPGSTVISVTPRVWGVGLGSVTPGTITLTMVDTAIESAGAENGTWRSEGTVTAPTIVWNIYTVNQKIDTLTIDASASTAWEGPNPVDVSPSDLLNGQIGVRASFNGMPGFAPSMSAIGLL